MLLRGMISATSFTVTGTMCKIATVVVNCLMWEKHASFEGLAALFVCLFAGMAYQQAPLRKDAEAARAAVGRPKPSANTSERETLGDAPATSPSLSQTSLRIMQ